MFRSAKQESSKECGRVGVSAILQYTVPVLREGREWYIEFYAYDPALDRMRRKRIKVNRVRGVRQRREYARGVLLRLTDQLSRGWNPWVSGNTDALAVTADVLSAYESYINKMYSSGYYREETYVGYRSYLTNLRRYIEQHAAYYFYQLDKVYLTHFLDEIFIGRDNSAQTYNNYLGWLRLFCGWCLQKGYTDHRATDGLQPISKRLITKRREQFTASQLRQVGSWCEQHDPYFLLACYLLYYCFVRPVEMTRLRVGDLDLKGGVLTVPGTASKNHKTQSVTVPSKVLRYAMTLGVFSRPSGEYLFGAGLRGPGKVPTTTKVMRDHWSALRKALKLPATLQFYSLKDSGITAMLRSDVASIAVRDQARHSSLSVTEIYTAHSVTANAALREFDGDL